MNTEIRRKSSQELAGREIVEITPVILGGSPTDPKNKTVLTRAEHIQAVVHWNRVIRELRNSHPTRTM